MNYKRFLRLSVRREFFARGIASVFLKLPSIVYASSTKMTAQRNAEWTKKSVSVIHSLN
jgi:hypothetical protein